MPLSAALLLMLQASNGEALIAEYKARTSAKIACKATQDSEEIIVCSLREADKKYRVPFVTARAIDNIPYQTERVLEDVMFQCGVTGPFLTQCGGMVGVTVGVGFDGKVVRKRELAP
jgi:hypothetical protein